jgi:hypothetical protein
MDLSARVSLERLPRRCQKGLFGRLPLNLWRKDAANAYTLEFPPTIENGSLTCSGLTTIGVGLANGCRAAGQGLTQVMASLPYQHMKTATTPKLKPRLPALSGPRQASKSQALRALFRGGHPAAADQRAVRAPGPGRGRARGQGQGPQGRGDIAFIEGLEIVSWNGDESSRFDSKAFSEAEILCAVQEGHRDPEVSGDVGTLPQKFASSSFFGRYRRDEVK